MTETRMADAWHALAETLDISNQDQHDCLRVVFLTGAMSAMVAVTSWDPDNLRTITINPDDVIAVINELTAIYHNDQERVCN